MRFYKLLSEYAAEIGVAEKLGSGADGIVWAFHSNKAIKFCIGNFNNIQGVLNLIEHKSDYYVKVYDYCKVSKYLEYDVYYYVMERLIPLSEDETKVFHTLISHEDCKKVKKYSIDDVCGILDEMSNFLLFDKEKVLFLIKKIYSDEIQHLDLSERNVMKDNRGNFKLIDLERIKI